MANVRDFGARGDGKTDDTAALGHALQHGDGELLLPRGDYVLSRPLYVPLEAHGRFSLRGSSGSARLIMAGPGPAVHLVGTHQKTALPDHVAEGVWRRERMPLLEDVEIVGGHPQADGVRLEGVMQPTLRGLLVRRCRHAVHLVRRARNVLISDCHLYDNSGVGVFFDRVNLHQTNVHGCHISYCKQAGIKTVGSEIRNLQICGNDIEYNYDAKAEDCADVYFDSREGSVREGTLVGNTIQAKESPGGANVRMVGVGKDNRHAAGLFTITGNLIASQHTAVHLRSCRGVVVSGNSLYGGYRYSLRAEDCEHLVVSGNSIDHNPDYKGNSTDHVLLSGCRNVNVTGLLLQHTREATAEAEASLELEGCENVGVSGCQLLGVRRRGIVAKNSSVVRISDCTIRPREGDRDFRCSVSADARCAKVLVTSSLLAKGADGDLLLPPEAGKAVNNLTL